MINLILPPCFLTTAFSFCTDRASKLHFEDKKDVFSDFFVDNDGNFVFTRGNRSNSRDFIQQLDLVVKNRDEDNFNLNRFDLSEHYLDEIKLKVDNVNNHYIINSLYYSKKTWQCRRPFHLRVG